MGGGHLQELPGSFRGNLGLDVRKLVVLMLCLGGVFGRVLPDVDDVECVERDLDGLGRDEGARDARERLFVALQSARQWALLPVRRSVEGGSRLHRREQGDEQDAQLVKDEPAPAKRGQVPADDDVPGLLGRQLEVRAEAALLLLRLVREAHERDGKGQGKGPKEVDEEQEEDLAVDARFHQGGLRFVIHLCRRLAAFVKVEMDVLGLSDFLPGRGGCRLSAVSGVGHHLLL